MKNIKLDSIGHEQDGMVNVLSNHEYNTHAWYEVTIHADNVYNKQHGCHYKRYMPIIYNF